MAELPVWWANVISALIFVAIGIAVFLVPRSQVLRGAPDGARWRDIRLWAVALVIVQLIIYTIFA